jgi:PQQ-like domain
MQLTKLSLFTTLTSALVPCVSAQATDWPQFGFDQAHSGNNPNENTITAANVSTMVKVFQATLPANVDSAPVFRAGVTTATGTKDLLFVTTQDGRTIALNAANGSVVWTKQPTMPASGSQITSTAPAIDPTGSFVFGYGLEGNVHKFAIGDGTEVLTGGWPQITTVKPGVEKGQSSLGYATVSGGATYLYMATDGYVGDGGDYQGHLTTINLATGTQNVFNVNCSNLTTHLVLNGTNGVNDCAQDRSGVWGRPGAIYHPGVNKVYIATGNGVYDASTGGTTWGDSVLGLAPDGTGLAGKPLDSYTPSNFVTLNNADLDLGSVSPAILPAPANSTLQNLIVQAGKDARLRLINLDNMSGAGNNTPGHVGGELQDIPVPQGGEVKPQPAVWVDTHGDGSTWLFVGNSSGISGLQLTVTAGAPSLTQKWTISTTSTSPIVANDVLYSYGGCPGGSCLIARNPITKATLWTSVVISGFHWQSPILVNGRIYVTDNSSHLHVFALDGIFKDNFEGAP